MLTCPCSGLHGSALHLWPIDGWNDLSKSFSKFSAQSAVYSVPIETYKKNTNNLSFQILSFLLTAGDEETMGHCTSVHSTAHQCISVHIIAHYCIVPLHITAKYCIATHYITVHYCMAFSYGFTFTCKKSPPYILNCFVGPCTRLITWVQHSTPTQ